MPTSHTGQINTIVDLITTINPKSILDIGIGHGKYGFLSREYLEAASDKDVYKQNKIRIDGIEGFPEYISPLQKLIYDNIYIGDALNIIDNIPDKYDLILMIDVFEHFSQEDGVTILKKCIEKAKNVLISCPKEMDEQGAEHGNVFQTHRFQWRKKHFNNYSNKAFVPNGYSLICLLGNNAQSIKSKWESTNMKIKIGTWFPMLRKIYLKIKSKKGLSTQ